MGEQTLSRRTVLQIAVTGIATSVAGCLGDDGGNGGGTDGDGRSSGGADESTPRETATATEMSDAAPGTATAESDTPTASQSTADVGIVASYPAAGGTEQRRETVLGPGDFESVGPVRTRSGRPPYVQATLTEAAAERFVDVLREHGFTGDGTANCRWQDRPDDPGWCLYTVVDGEVTYAAGLGAELADVVESGAFVDNRTFVLQTATATDAEELKDSLDGNSD